MARRLLVLALALAAASCGNRGATVQFSAICAPTAECTFQATCDAQYIGEIRLDLADLPATARDLTLFVEVHNQALSSADSSSGRTNTRDAFLREISVEYEGAVAVPATTTLIQQSVPANGTGVLGIQVVDPAGVTALGAGLPGALTAVMVASIKGKGVYGDGSSFETMEFRVPFLVCRNCTGRCAATGFPPTPLSCPHDGQHPNACPAAVAP